MNQLIQQIEQWANDRNLINGSTPQKQMLKLMEEFGELCAGIAKNKPEMIKDAIGDCVVVLTILNKQFNLKNKFSHCLELEQRNIAKKYDSTTELDTLADFEFWSNGYELIEEIHNYNDLNEEFHDELPEVEFDFEEYQIRKEEICNRLQFLIHECFLALLALCYDKKLSMQDCVQYAYSQIKNRKGKMIDGVFVKEEDLSPP